MTFWLAAAVHAGTGWDEAVSGDLSAPEDVGTNFLGNFLAPGQTSLASGDCSEWIKETGGPVSYGFDFMLTAEVGREVGAMVYT